MSAETSVSGRFQFSTEKAYRVSTGMPMRAEVSTVARTDSLPARGPSSRARWREAARRPFPAMMMATWRGSRVKSRRRSRSSSADPAGTAASMSARPMTVSADLSPDPDRGETVVVAREVGRCRRRGSGRTRPSVEHALEYQTRRWRGAAGPPAIARFERGAHPVRRPRPQSDIHQRTGADPDPVAKKALALHFDVQLIACRHEIRAVHDATRVDDRRSGRLERRKIVCADERGCRLP